MLDLDHFKRVNDEYGHLAGDKVLISTVQCLQTILRPYDRIYRYGGEEFLLCMPGTTPEEAREVAERMCHAVAAQRIQPDGFDNILQVTASLGVAMLDPSRPVEASIEIADKTMYEAKKSGRNRVVTEY
jgi:diguanylate cyclase|tara:strand:- start:94861 stop:95247 length:387 start_codon:yes stop_codon:yes gene_type:complete